jgi:SagB-type dehydrogenase family enzyme
VSGRPQVDPPVSRACDRTDVDLVLSSGVVLADYGLDRPVPAQRPSQLASDAEWLLAPGASSCLEADRLTLSFDLLPDEIFVDDGRISVARTRRTVDVHSDRTTLRRLFDGLSRAVTLDRLTGDLPEHLRDSARDIVADLVGWRAVVADTGARSRLAHSWSMRSTRSRGRLSPAEVAELTFSPETREDGDAAIVDLAPPRPFPIDSLSQVLRLRRSPASYDSSPISLDQLGQLLGGACGVTGELVMADRRLPLRAYPSPGALYAVDLFVIPTRVKGLGDGVFRYEPARHALVAVHDRRIDPVSFCLPDVRAVAGGIAAFIALSIALPRATRKYGDESYRILVAEAGCMAENLVLVAHALGLRAGPFTGVFDGLVDRAIGLGPDEARFVVGVLVGREGEGS